MQRSHLSLLAVVTATSLASLTFACGGSAYSPTFDVPPGDDGGTAPDGSPPIDSGSSTPWSPLCPASVPAIGAPCSATWELQCEYGGASWNISCDVVVQCDNGQWTAYEPSYEPCTPAPGPNVSACPATLASVAQGSACSSTDLSCQYATGSCACEPSFGGPIPEDDAGAAGYWGCIPEQGCPFPRPRVGSACSSDGAYCTYEPCTYAQTCTGGVWQGNPEACAAPEGF